MAVKFQGAVGRRIAMTIGRWPVRRRAGGAWLIRRWLQKILHDPEKQSKLSSRYASINQLAATHQLRKKSVRPAKPIGIQVSRTYPPRIRRTLTELERCQELESVVVEFDGLHLTQEGDCAVSDGTVLNDLWVNCTTPAKSRDRVITKALASVPVDLEGLTSSVCIPYAHTYAHWLYQALPRIGMLTEAGYRIGELNIVIPDQASNWMIRTLELLGVERKKMVRAGDEVLRGKLVVARAPRIQMSVEGVAFLRSSFSRFFQPPTTEKVFLSRPDEYGRRLLNERKVWAMLEALGYQKIDPALLSIEEQVGLFSRVAEIVAVHGSGLANIVFCRGDAKVVEIFPANHIGSAFYAVASRVGLSHRCIIGCEPAMPSILDRAFRNEHPGYYNSTIDDLRVPLRKLANLVDERGEIREHLIDSE